MKNRYIEKEKTLDVIDDVDIIVAGGGTAGCVAAIAAARRGARVMVIEQFGSLGGTATGALVTPLMGTGIEGNPMCSAISDEINQRMEALGCFSLCYNGCGYFDPTMLEIVLEEMVLEAGAKVLYYTYICDVIKEDSKVMGIITENKASRNVIYARCIIDCTGDGDVAYLAGAGCEKGDPDTGKNQHMAVRYMVSGIEVPRFIQFMEKVLDGKDKAHYRVQYPYYHAAVVWGRNWPLEPLFKKAYEAGDIAYSDGHYWQLFGVPGRRDTFAFNCPEISEGTDGTDPLDLTNAQIQAKKVMMRHIRFYKKYFPGFENCYIAEIANQVGIRETRRIKGIYTLTDSDVMAHKKFEDSIAASNYQIDVHGKKLVNGEIGTKGKEEKSYYDIPYRCLVPAGIKGLLVAGRCISASFVAQSSLRIMPTVRAIGEAAGIAAAMALQQSIGLDEIKGQDIRQEMIRRGAVFP